VGGLAGGWFAALFALSHLGVRLTLSLTAVVVALIAVGWTRAHAGQWPTRIWLAPAATAILAWATPAPAREIGPEHARGRIISSVQGATGLVQVLDVPAIDGRFLVIDGTVQGAARRSTGKSLVEFSEYLELGARWCRPDLKRVLVVGLGAGTLARSLALSGVETVAVEIDPAVVTAARQHFDLPPSVEVAVRDARELIRSDARRYDAILLDVYRGESFPWHLGTQEAFESMRTRLEPGGCVAVNGIVKKSGESPGFARLEAAAATTFAHVGVFRARERDASGERWSTSARHGSIRDRKGTLCLVPECPSGRAHRHGRCFRFRSGRQRASSGLAQEPPG
jgi:spermidine synthase